MIAANSKILPLDSLRGFAAIVVVLFHCANGSSLTNNMFVQSGPLMVDFFFVLSGFVIALNYMDRIHDFDGLVEFQTRRFGRLYPLHLFTLLVFLGIECLKLAAQRHGHSEAGSPAFSSNDLVAFVNNLFLTQALFLDHVSFNYPAWSISTEFYTYLIFALVMLTGRIRLALCVSLSIVGWGALESLDPQYHEVYTRFFRCLYAFFLGVLGYVLAKQPKHNIPTVVVALFFILSIVAILFLFDSPYHIFIPLIVLLTACAFARTNENSSMVKLLSIWPLVYLGTISYSLYMMHAIVWWASNQVLRFVFKVTSHQNQAGQSIMDLTPGTSVAVTLLGVAMIIAVSHVTYYQAEMRFRRIKSRGRRPDRSRRMPTMRVEMTSEDRDAYAVHHDPSRESPLRTRRRA